ncbi:phosphomethylpyrimidine synthase ThiC, partial [Acinetobacter baumannii]
MSVAVNELFKAADELSADVRKPFPGSRKIHVEGPHGIRVPMREIALTPTRTRDGDEPNAAVTVYDTSGPYTDPGAIIDLRKGLPAQRDAWIEA